MDSYFYSSTFGYTIFGALRSSSTIKVSLFLIPFSVRLLSKFSALMTIGLGGKPFLIVTPFTFTPVLN
jgi:hypothetical protein